MTARRVGPLAVREAGTPDGHPLLFLHGIGSSGSAFSAQLDHFAVHRWCLAPDAPGYADSDDDPAIESLDDYVVRYLGLLDELKVARADVVGVSWGGVIATRMAATRAERVTRLVLADSSRGSGIDPARAEAMRGRPELLAAEGAESFSRNRSPRLLSPDASPDLIAAVAADMAASIRLPGYAQAAASMADTDNTELLATITKPTLVVVGDADIVCPPAESALLTEHIPNASMVVLRGAGHLANREQSVDFNRAVDGFLADTEP